MFVDKERVERLIEYTERLISGENGKALFDQYRSDIESVKPSEVFDLFYYLINEKYNAKTISIYLDKVINVFYKSLLKYEWKKPEEEDFINNILAENSALVSKIEDIKMIIKSGDWRVNRKILSESISELKQFNEHYLKKEHVLFPYLEKRVSKFECLNLMKYYHNRIREDIRATIKTLEDDATDESEIIKGLGSLIRNMLSILKKEELILIPVASEVLEQTDWNVMYKQSFEYDFPFIEKPEALFSTLPLELTFIDAQDVVCYFSKTKADTLQKSTEIVGKRIEQWYPAERLNQIVDIIESFKQGKSENELLRVIQGTQHLLVQYHALRDSTGKYVGTIEINPIIMA